MHHQRQPPLQFVQRLLGQIIAHEKDVGDAGLREAQPRHADAIHRDSHAVAQIGWPGGRRNISPTFGSKYAAAMSSATIF